MSLRFQTSGFDRLEALVRRLGDAPREVAEVAAAMIEDQIEQRIDVEKSAPAGGTWAPWSPSYARSGEGRELLERSGDLLSSIHHQIAGEVIEVGSDLQYAEVQDRRRPFIGLSRENEAQLVTVVEAELERIAESAA